MLIAKIIHHLQLICKICGYLIKEIDDAAVWFTALWYQAPQYKVVNDILKSSRDWFYVSCTR